MQRFHHFIILLINFINIKNNSRFMNFSLLPVTHPFLSLSSKFSHWLPPTDTPSPISNSFPLELYVQPILVIRFFPLFIKHLLKAYYLRWSVWDGGADIYWWVHLSGGSSYLEDYRFFLKCHLCATSHPVQLIFMWLKWTHIKKDRFFNVLKLDIPGLLLQVNNLIVNFRCFNRVRSLPGKKLKWFYVF